MLRAEGVDVRTSTRAEQVADRRLVVLGPDGTQDVLDSDRILVGATVVAESAGESIAEMVVWIHRGAQLRDMVIAIHAYPTMTEGPWRAVLSDPAFAEAVGFTLGVSVVTTVLSAALAIPVAAALRNRSWARTITALLGFVVSWSQYGTTLAVG